MLGDKFKELDQEVKLKPLQSASRETEKKQQENWSIKLGGRLTYSFLKGKEKMGRKRVLSAVVRHTGGRKGADFPRHTADPPEAEEGVAEGPRGGAPSRRPFGEGLAAALRGVCAPASR